MNRQFVPSPIHRWMTVAVLAASFSAAAAELRLVSTAPADGDLSVAVDGTILLTSDAPIDTASHFKKTGGPHYIGLNFHPLGKSGRPDSTTFSPDMKTVRFHDVHLCWDTQYVLVVTGAKSESGDSLRRPVSVTFTTGDSLPTGKVVGKVLAATGSPVNALVQVLDMTFDGPDVYACSRVDMEDGTYALYHVPPGNTWPLPSSTRTATA